VFCGVEGDGFAYRERQNSFTASHPALFDQVDRIPFIRSHNPGECCAAERGSASERLPELSDVAQGLAAEVSRHAWSRVLTKVAKLPAGVALSEKKRCLGAPDGWAC